MDYELFKNKCLSFMKEDHYATLFVQKDSQTSKNYLRIPETHSRNILSQVVNSFVWDNQSEGGDYWMDMCNEYLDLNVMVINSERIESLRKRGHSCYHELELQHSINQSI